MTNPTCKHVFALETAWPCS